MLHGLPIVTDNEPYLTGNAVTSYLPQSSQGLPPPPPLVSPPQGALSQHHPQVHHATTPVMGNHNGYTQVPGPIPHNINRERRGQLRAMRACEECRQRKRKCDEGKRCSYCEESNLTCQYRDTPPGKTDKNMDKVIAKLEQVAQDYQDLRQSLDTTLSGFDDQLRPREQRESSPVTPGKPSKREERPSKRKPELDDHRTAPHKLLLLWPSVKLLLQEANVDVNDGYVMEAEDLGVLRLHSRGEGIEELDSISDAPSPPEEFWGYGLSEYAYPSSESCSRPYTAGGLKPDGTLDLDQTIILDLWESYVKHVHAMHPFLDKAGTCKLIKDFIARRCSNRHRTHSTWAVDDSESDRFSKRQRSNDPYGYQRIGAGASRRGQSIDTERSASNAVVHLVLALGKICTHKGDLLGSRRSSSNDSFSSQPAKNIEIIPGLAYYAKAAEILGDQIDGNDLIHAQMFLLAGLYKGQLARVKESMSWITMAGRVIQTLLDRFKLYNDNYWTTYSDVRRPHEKGQKLITDMQQNLMVIASWTCLQLESDILAELRLPSSGIQNIENLLLMPHDLAEEETFEGLAPHEDKKGESYNNVILFYTAQMFLRKRLNQVHRELYGSDCLEQPLAEVQAILHGHKAILHGWRAMLPPDLTWRDDEPPPGGILSARLRAKYWGARYVINRPFLDYALHIMPHVRDGSSVEEVALDVHRNPRDKAEIHLFKAIKLMGESEVWEACKQCIEAAMQSTVALDGVPDRLIVTNIHGTAHA